jgi:hypothetical protein
MLSRHPKAPGSVRGFVSLFESVRKSSSIEQQYKSFPCELSYRKDSATTLRSIYNRDAERSCIASTMNRSTRLERWLEIGMAYVEKMEGPRRKCEGNTPGGRRGR